ncbi:hypothetical protein ACTXT7_016533 [Hymenolepis weldensis]
MSEAHLANVTIIAIIKVGHFQNDWDFFFFSNSSIDENTRLVESSTSSVGSDWDRIDESVSSKAPQIQNPEDTAFVNVLLGQDPQTSKRQVNVAEVFYK